MKEVKRHLKIFVEKEMYRNKKAPPKSNQRFYQPRSQGICSWGAIYPGMVWSRDPRILRKMASCLLGLGGEYILSQLNMINLIALII